MYLTALLSCYLDKVLVVGGALLKMNYHNVCTGNGKPPPL